MVVGAEEYISRFDQEQLDKNEEAAAAIAKKQQVARDAQSTIALAREAEIEAERQRQEEQLKNKKSKRTSRWWAYFNEGVANTTHVYCTLPSKEDPTKNDDDDASDDEAPELLPESDDEDEDPHKKSVKQLEKYLDLKQAPPDTAILDWWFQNEAKYPCTMKSETIQQTLGCSVNYNPWFSSVPEEEPKEAEAQAEEPKEA
ncbi:hypothetical protein CYMTET_26791 [Cymbomonas tetramitiformis]|uniref:Uncharacterized protein n=1 Tax=Cymbomonas tetramitiformis TaxID=36881 RepID=A0AAE0KXS9_9CHLO|nr:hypothetical protein CYMTET_26791 [Cymbomonas tetramitiformis]